MPATLGMLGEAVAGSVVEVGASVTTLTDANIRLVYARERSASSDRKTYLANTLRACGRIAYGEADPANTCMEFFLNRNAPTGGWTFDLSILFAEDSSVRSRVFSEVIRRTVGSMTQREQIESFSSNLLSGRTAALAKPIGLGVRTPAEIGKMMEPQMDPVISIFQQNYSSAGWWGALGSFPLTWKRLDSARMGDRVAVQLGGENLYDWHPKDKRQTKFLHEIAAELTQMGAAAPFTMKAAPLTVVVDTANARIDDVQFTYTGFQTNPVKAKGGMAQRAWDYHINR